MPQQRANRSTPFDVMIVGNNRFRANRGMPLACQIDEIIKAGNDRPFTTLPAAHAAGYDNCAWCLEGSRR
jgi:hypothetical protein